MGVCPSVRLYVCLSVADSILKKIVRGKLWNTLDEPASRAAPASSEKFMEQLISNAEDTKKLMK